jgi:hypothetical protein
MGRRTEHLTVTREGRDQNGIVEIREMSAYDATELCLRAMQCVARGGVDIPPELLQMGAQGIVVMGAGAIIAGLGKTPWYEVKPLLDALLTCVVSYQPPGAIQPVRGIEVIKGQIEEPSTFLWIYEEVVSLHLGFSLRERLSSYRTMVTTMINDPTPDTSTSSDPSASSSAPNSQP